MSSLESHGKHVGQNIKLRLKKGLLKSNFLFLKSFFPSKNTLEVFLAIEKFRKWALLK